MSKMGEKTLYRSHSKRLFLFLGLITLLILMTNFASADITTDLKYHYKFEDNLANTVVVDTQGNQNGVAGVNTNVLYNSSGVNGGSFYFNGTANHGVSINGVSTTGATSVAFWVNFESVAQGPTYLFDTQTDRMILGFVNGGNGVLQYYDGVDYRTIASGIQTKKWYHIALTSDGTNSKAYINASLNFSGGDDWSVAGTTRIASNFAGDAGWTNARIDDFRIYDRELSITDIEELYNFLEITTVSINLTSPSNATTISDDGANFTVQLNMTGSNLQYIWRNTTYYVWKNGTEVNSTFINLVALEENNTIYTQFIDDFTFGNYEWNVYSCYGNGTATNCSWAENNYTFDVVAFSVISEEYNNITLEGSTNTFKINMSVFSGERLSTLKFVYNDIEYGGSFTEYSTGEYYASYNLKTPTLTNSIQNYTFYWIAEFESGYKQNSTLHNQTVVKIYLDDCSTYTYQLLNFTVHDEITKAKLDGATDNVTVKIDFELSYLDNSARIIQYANEYLNTNPARVCMQNQSYDSSLRMDAVVEYSSNGRFTEFYNIQNFVFNSTTDSRNISLYDLNSSVGQEFKITYRGIDYIPVADLIIQIQRKYIEDGQFRTVEIPMSGSNGYTIAHLVPNNVIYNLIFIKDGVVLDSFLNVIATCQNPTFTECEINLNNEVSGEDLFDLIETENFFSSLSYDRITRFISSTFGLYDGTSGTATLQVYLADNIGTTQVCNDTLTGAGGTLSCAVPSSIGNSTVYAVVLFDGEVKREGFINLGIKPKELWGDSLIFSILIIFLFLVGMGLTISGSDGMTYGLFLIIGMILLTAVNLLYTKSWIGTGASILWLLIAIIMVMIKSGSKR